MNGGKKENGITRQLCKHLKTKIPAQVNKTLTPRVRT